MMANVVGLDRYFLRVILYAGSEYFRMDLYYVARLPSHGAEKFQDIDPPYVSSTFLRKHRT